jgi:hypothetical protein
MELYPSMPETWKAAESKCRKEVSGMGGYQRHVSGNDGKQINVKDHTSHSGKREVRRQGLRQCRIRKVLRGGTMKKRYPAWQDTKSMYPAETERYVQETCIRHGRIHGGCIRP